MKKENNERYYGGLPHSSKTRQLPTVRELADGLEQAARAMGKGVKSDVTANIAWAIRKGDRSRVQKLLDKHIDDILGGQGTVNLIMQWMDGQLPEGMEASMRSLIQRLEEATGKLSKSTRRSDHAELQHGDIVRTRNRSLARLNWPDDPGEEWVNKGDRFKVYDVRKDTINAIPLNAYNDRQYYILNKSDVEVE